MMTLDVFKGHTGEGKGGGAFCPDLTDEAITTLAFVTLYENGERLYVCEEAGSGYAA